MNTFGQNLKKYRKEAKLSQAKLGELAGYSQNAISKMEKGEAERPRKLDRLADVLKVSEQQLLFADEDGKSIALHAHPEITLTAEHKRLLLQALTIAYSDLEDLQVLTPVAREDNFKEIAQTAVVLFNSHMQGTITLPLRSHEQRSTADDQQDQNAS